MAQEDKELLFKDLCARLPYGLKVQVYFEDIAGSGYFDENVWLIDNDEPFHVNDRWIENITPYLRPMSSMTDEELKEFISIHENVLVAGKNKYTIILSLDATDWLNAHHFDYRGLIEKGLALEASKEMYK